MSIMRKAIATGALAVALGSAGVASASSHREAPGIAEDQYADNTDTYMFISPDSPNRVVLVANYVPLLLPASGPNFYRFADSVLYEMRLDNNGDAVPDISYEFRFRTSPYPMDTFLYNNGAITGTGVASGAGLRVAQTYSVTRRDLAAGTTTSVFTDVPVAPWYVGSRSFAGAMGSNPDANYENVARMAIRTMGTGEMSRRVFAGPRDEPFFVDLHVFDLLGVTTPDMGPSSTYGANVMSIVLEVPIDDVAAGGARPTGMSPVTSQAVGYYATASRRQVRILRRGRSADSFGQWVQVSRLGWPLVNEAVIAMGNKDFFNRANPVDDLANFGADIVRLEINGLLRGVLMLPCTMSDGLGGTLTMGDPVDTLAALLSGAGNSLPPGSLTPADLLRLNITAGQTNAMSHFPNGRALADDVADTVLTVACSAPMTPVGDFYTANDRDPIMTGFPFLSTPHSGNPPLPPP